MNFPIQLAIQAAKCDPLGGYCFPSNSTLGSQVHQSPAGTPSMTFAMCLPHPVQVVFSGEIVRTSSNSSNEKMGMNSRQVAHSDSMHIVADGGDIEGLFCLGALMSVRVPESVGV